MDTSHCPSRLVPALAVTAVCIAAIGAVGHRLADSFPRAVPAPTRPAADAPVNVVKAPATVQPDAVPCTTCAMGAGRGPL